MRVALDGHIWTFNPLSVILVNTNSELGNSVKEEDRDGGKVFFLFFVNLIFNFLLNYFLQL